MQLNTKETLAETQAKLEAAQRVIKQEEIRCVMDDTSSTASLIVHLCGMQSIVQPSLTQHALHLFCR